MPPYRVGFAGKVSERKNPERGMRLKYLTPVRFKKGRDRKLGDGPIGSRPLSRHGLDAGGCAWHIGTERGGYRRLCLSRGKKVESVLRWAVSIVDWIDGNAIKGEEKSLMGDGKNNILCWQYMASFSSFFSSSFFLLFFFCFSFFRDTTISIIFFS